MGKDDSIVARIEEQRWKKVISLLEAAYGKQLRGDYHLGYRVPVIDGSRSLI